MVRLSLFAAAGVFAFSANAFAAPQLQRVRGTVESATDSAITIKTADGKSQQVMVAPGTAYVSVVKSSLSDVGDGKFIGTATKGEPPVALEVVIFPAAMKGTGEGHYDWDEINDTTGKDTMAKSSMTKSSMTNGTVKAGSNMMAKSKMTNGTVKSGSTMGDKKKITVTYDNGQSLDIIVPPSAPIVAFEKADKSIVKPGTDIFTVAALDGDKLDGKLVAIGKDGVKPPM